MQVPVLRQHPDAHLLVVFSCAWDLLGTLPGKALLIRSVAVP
jgi:hypothetical protein